MHKLTEILVNKLLEFELISEDKKDNYFYGVEMLVMKIFSIIVIGIIAIMLKKYVETVVFYITFTSLRTYTNGYHSKYYWLCLIESAIIYTLICLVIVPVVMSYLYESYFFTGIAIISIFILSPANSENIMFSKDEIEEHKKIIKYILIIDSVCLFMFINFKVTLEIVAFFEVAIILDSISIIIEKFIIFYKYLKNKHSNY